MADEASHHPPVDGLCPRCGTEVSELSRRCRECLLQLQPGEDISQGQTAMLRRVWENEHPEATEAFERWAAAPEGPPPGVTDPVHPPEPDLPLGPWQPLEARMQRVVILLAAVVLLDAIAIGVDVAHLDLLTRIEGGQSVTRSEAEGSDARMSVVGTLQLLLTVATGIVFILWFHRAYRNVGAIRGARRRYADWWAIFGWFVPIMFLFRPKQVANDLWAAGGTDMTDSQPPLLLAAWWGAFLIAEMVSRSLLSGSDASSDVTRRVIAADAIDLAAAILAIVVVIRITRRLEARHAETVSPPEPAAAPPA